MARPRDAKKQSPKDMLHWEAERICSDGRRCFGSYPGDERPPECQTCWAADPCYWKTMGSKDPFAFFDKKQSHRWWKARSR